MKLKSLILIAVVFALLSFKTEKNKLNGTWKIVSQVIISSGQKNKISYNHQNSGLKTWSDKYFMFVSNEKNGSQTQNYYGAGTYELSGNAYVENIQYHVAPNYRGLSLKLNLEIKGDTLIQIYPVDDNYNYDKNNCNIQKYVRVD